MPEPKKPRKLAANQLLEYAVTCLSARAYSSGDLKAKLRLRAARAADVDPAIGRLQEIGYLNDERFAESYAALRVQNDSFGRMRVLTDLRKHRIGADLAEQATDQALEGRSEAEMIEAYIERRMPSVVAGTGLDEQKKLAAAYRRLRRAGFTSGPVLTALKQHAAKPELLDDFPEDQSEEEEEVS